MAMLFFSTMRMPRLRAAMQQFAPYVGRAHSRCRVWGCQPVYRAESASQPRVIHARYALARMGRASVYTAAVSNRIR